MHILENPHIRSRVQPLSLETYQMLCKLEPKRYAKTELFRGVVIKKMIKSSEHNYFKVIFTEEIRKVLPISYFIQNENSIQTQHSELEPDISVILGSPKDYRHQKPKTARLVVEISVSSIAYDQEKALDYAQANVEEYWIVDVEKELVEVYTSPTQNGYTKKGIFHKEENLPLFNSHISLQKVFE